MITHLLEDSIQKRRSLNNRKYETHEIELKKDEWVFMYSDGYYDQFGVR